MGAVLQSISVQSTQRPHVQQRMVYVPTIRLSSEERAQIKSTFDRLQDAGLLPYWQFRTHVLGSQMPEHIAQRIYEMFSTQTVVHTVHELEQPGFKQTEIHCGMKLEDVVAFYAAAKNRTYIDQVAYWLVKSRISRSEFIRVQSEQQTVFQTDEEDPNLIASSELLKYVRKTLQMGNDEIADLKAKLQEVGLAFYTDCTISKAVFLQKFGDLQDLQIFKWFFDLLKGFKPKYLNIDNTQNPLDERRLTIASVERQKKQIEKNTTLSPDELTLIQEFYEEECRSRSLKYTLALFQKMFSQVKNETLRTKYLINAAMSKQGKFEFLCQLVQAICKSTTENDEELIFKFLFDLFSHYQPTMKRQQVKDFSDIFKIPLSDFPSDHALNYEQFATTIDEYEMHHTEYTSCKPMLLAMMCLTPANDLEEKQAVLAAVNQNPNIESYIHDNFTSEIEQFYVVERQFWEQWQASIGFQETGEAFGLRVEHKNYIENRSIMEPYHKFRLKGHCQYLSEFVILPKFVFRPLSKWYGCDVELTRSVITYKQLLRQSRTSGLQKQDSLRSSYSKNFKVSGQKFNSKRPDLIDDDYITLKGDMSFELEIAPKIVYLSLVDSVTGEKMFDKLVVQNRVDFEYMKRVLKMDKLPLMELQLSRKTTLDWLLSHASKKFQKNPKKGRLLIGDSVYQGAQKLLQTLEDLKIETGTLVHAEFINDSNEWPSEKSSAPSQSQKQNQSLPIQKRSAGLANLGNTCYMNSAIQVIANLKHIHEYFVQTKQYQSQINAKAPLAHGGLLAMSFGNLMNQMWSGQSEQLAPKLFKTILGKCNAQFASFDQQDSQEYLSFMIDSLHEELNLRLKKPYIQNPDSKGRRVQSLALENWSNTLKREWSLMLFLFYGQMRSNLTCQQCRNESSTFDIFSNVPLSLPEPTQMTISIIIYRVPNKVKDILNGKITKSADGTYSLPQFGQEDIEQYAASFTRPISSARNSGMLRSKSTLQQQQQTAQNQFADSFNYLSNDQPLRVHIKVEPDTSIKTITSKILAIREANLDKTQTRTNTLLFGMNRSTKLVRKVYQPDDKLSEIDLLSYELHMMELLTRKGKDLIRSFYKANQGFLTQFVDARLQSLCFPSAKDELDQVNPFLPDLRKPNERQPGLVQNSQASALDIQMLCYNRRFVGKENTQLAPAMPQIVSHPILLWIPRYPSGRRLYDEVWTVASNLVKPNSKLQKPGNRWWERKDWEKHLDSNSIFKPFILKSVQQNGISCSRCHWTKGCAGCIIEPTDTPNFIKDLSENSIVAIEWHPESLAENYNHLISEVVEHSSVSQELDDAALVNYTSLDDCISKFHKTEQLENEVKCEKCAVATVHLKKMEIFRPPPVLVIQLKRFRQVGLMWRKVQTSVDFPLKNLDFSQYVTDLDFLVKNGIETKYDLHGMVSHFGTLTFGHYISFVQNPFDQRWYMYDDGKVTSINEQQLNKESAYILFYVRKDIQNVKVAELFPQIEYSIFPGRPLTTKQGQNGYCVTSASEQSVQVEFTNDPDRTPTTIQLKDLALETDSSVIELSEDDKKRIEKLLKLRSGEDIADSWNSQRKESEEEDDAAMRCCNLFPGVKASGKNNKRDPEIVRKFSETPGKVRTVQTFRSASDTQKEKILPPQKAVSRCETQMPSTNLGTQKPEDEGSPVSTVGFAHEGMSKETSVEALTLQDFPIKASKIKQNAGSIM